MTHLIENLSHDHWHLMLAILLLFALWRLGTLIVGERPLFRWFPRLTAALDLVVLPAIVVVTGSLARIAADLLSLPTLKGPLLWLTLLIGHLAAGWALARFIEVSLLLRAEEDKRRRVPKLVIGLIYLALLLVGLGVFFWERGYSFTGVWVSTGVAAGVIGLALQRTLGDLFAGITLGLERPYSIGDWLELDDGTVGQVIDMNWRATHLRAWNNTTIIVPNARMAGEKLCNYHDERHLYAPWYFVKLPAEVDPRFASELLLDAALRCESVLKFPNPVVRLTDASGIPYTYMVWVHLKNYPSMFRGREELYREIHRGLQQAGIEIAPQIQEIRTRRALVTAAEPPSIELALRSLDVAGVLTEEELKETTARSEYRYFNAGHVIVAAGSVSDAFYVITGGLVDSVVRREDGAPKLVETLGPGEHFGITAMLTTEPSLLEFTAKSDVTVIRVELDCLRTIMAARPDLAAELAAVIKQRLDAAEAARAASRRPPRRLSLRDIRHGIEQRMRRPQDVRRD